MEIFQPFLIGKFSSTATATLDFNSLRFKFKLLWYMLLKVMVIIVLDIDLVPIWYLNQWWLTMKTPRNKLQEITLRFIIYKKCSIKSCLSLTATFVEISMCLRRAAEFFILFSSPKKYCMQTRSASADVKQPYHAIKLKIYSQNGRPIHTDLGHPTNIQ